MKYQHPTAVNNNLPVKKGEEGEEKLVKNVQAERRKCQ